MTRRNSIQNLFYSGELYKGEHTLPKNSHQKRQRQNTITFGINEIDNCLAQGGLSVGHIHEWALETTFASSWQPPLFITSYLVGRALKTATANKLIDSRTFVFWIGQKTWPTPHLLNTTLNQIPELWDWHRNCIFINPCSKTDCAWAINKILQSPIALAVLADGSGLNVTTLKQLKRSARMGETLLFLFRKPSEIKLSSPAQTKWLVSPLPSKKNSFHWSLTLLRAHGSISEKTWQVGYDEQTHSIDILPQLAQSNTSNEEQTSTGTTS